MPTRRDFETQATVGSINANASPPSLARPLVANGDLVLMQGFWAQITGNTEPFVPAGLSLVITGGTVSNRLGGLFLAEVTDAAAFNAGGAFSVRCVSTTSTRVASLIASWSPSAGKHWDLGSVVASGPESNPSAQTSDAFPTVAARDFTLGVAMTNKGASTSLTRHVVPSGSDTIQARAASGVTNENPSADPPTLNTNSVSDSVISATVIPAGGGATVNFVSQNAEGGSSVTPLSQAAGACVMFTMALNEVDDDPGPDPLPEVTGHGFVSVQQMLRTKGCTWAHRNVGGTFPEMTEYGARMAANLGFGMIEVSVVRSADGTYWGSHDLTPNRVAVETTYDGQDFSTLTDAQIGSLHANVGSSGAPKPFATLQQIVETLPPDFLFMVDNKPRTNNSEYLDLIDTLLGPERAVIKIDGSASVTLFEQAKARGYITAAYWYNESNWANIPGKMHAVDLAGLNAQPTLAADSYWTDLRALTDAQTAIDGVQRYIWGHVITSQSGYDTAISKGADFVQVTNAVVQAVGVESWRPGVMADGFAPKELYVGDALAQKVYLGDTLIWEREESP